MLFINDYKLEIFNGRKYCRSCADNYTGFTEADSAPFIEAFAVAQMAVKHRNIIAESAAESIRCLRGKRNLRHEYYRAAACIEHFGDRLHIDLGLAASCDSVKKYAFSGRCRVDYIKRLFLFRCQFRGLIESDASAERAAKGDAAGLRNSSLFNKRGYCSGCAGNISIDVGNGKLGAR